MTRSTIIYALLLLIMMGFGFTSCSSDDDDDLVGNWVERGSFEGQPRSDAVVFTVGNEAFIGTGYDGTENERLKDFWKYDVEKDYWSQVASLPGVSRNGAVAFGTDTKGYVGTGYDGTNRLNDFYSYDPKTNEWTSIAPFAGTARYGAVAFGINNKGYVGTGYDSNVLKDFWEYNPDTDTWTQKVSVGGSKRRDATAFVMDGKGYIVTGVDNGQYVDDFYYYIPEEDRWVALNKIADVTDYSFDDDYSLVCINAVSFVMNGKAYITTGGPGYPGNGTWEFNPVTDRWKEKTNFEGSSRYGAVAFNINNVGYVTTGRSSGYYLDDLWTFDPDAEYEEND